MRPPFLPPLRPPGRERRPLSAWVACLASFDATMLVIGVIGPPHHWWFWLEAAAPNAVAVALALHRRRVARARQVVDALEREYDRQAAPLGAGLNGHHSPTVKTARRR